MTRKYFLCFFILSVICGHFSFATHIRAGEIIVKRSSNATNSYRFFIIGYTDTESDVEFGGGTVDFGDGTREPLIDIVIGQPLYLLIEDQVAYNLWEVEHTFPGAGRYTVRYEEQNRNAGVVNMSNSVNTPFYIESEVLIDPFIGPNNSPEFTVPPIDRGAVTAAFLHNPGAFDVDGDSLSYRLTKPKKFYDRVVDDYKEPNDRAFYTNYDQGNQEGDGPPIFEIDEATGLLTWDAPGAQGEYNMAFVVDEWRQVEGLWLRIGSVTRDMQVIIDATDNQPPEIVEIEDACVVAGTPLVEVVTAIDPDDHMVELSAFGGPFEVTESPATYTPFPAVFQPQPANLRIEWNTVCSHVRLRSYDVQLKARDQPEQGAKLVDFKTWGIKVIGPAPTGLQTTVLPNRQMQLDWDAYRDCGDAEVMEIWRRVDSYDISADDCVPGMPANAGYQLIDSVMITGPDATNTYTDDNNGVGLAPGAMYCYRIVARFAEPGGGLSLVSAEACDLVGIVAPVTLNVDVLETDTENGEVYVRWEEPLDLPLSEPRPFTFELMRYTGTNVGNEGVLLTTTQDKEFTDTGLNTFDNSYSYIVRAYNANYSGTQDAASFIDSSVVASTVRLDARPGLEDIELIWSGNVPWSIVSEEFPNHDVYRSIHDGFGWSFQQIGSADVTMNGLRFLDDGTFNGQPLDEDIVYAYYVETQGTYGNDTLPEPLINKSQVVLAQTNDLEPPCTPVSFSFDENFDCESFLAQRGCDYFDYYTELSWMQDGDSECDNDIVSYNIYFSEESGQADLPLLANVTGLSYRHDDKNSFKGFYQIASVDRSGNISDRSEIIAIDNCPNIRMPNAFSPNGDGFNDTFTPFMDTIGENTGEGGGDDGSHYIDTQDCIRFALEMEFIVFDRTGGILFEYDSRETGLEQTEGKWINWDGTNNWGRELPGGTYYYKLTVEFDVLEPSESIQTFNGWVQIIR